MKFSLQPIEAVPGEDEAVPDEDKAVPGEDEINSDKRRLLWVVFCHQPVERQNLGDFGFRNSPDWNFVNSGAVLGCPLWSC